MEGFGTDSSAYIAQLKDILGNLPLDRVSKATDTLFTCYQTDHTVFTFGNGGSGALASHLAADFGKGTHFPGPKELSKFKRMKTLAVTDRMPMIMAWANDVNYEIIFMRQIENFINPGDVAFGVSGSSNSTNVLKTLELGRRVGAITVGLVGFGGGKVKNLLDCAVIVPFM